jgi:hypothetical protein
MPDPAWPNTLPEHPLREGYGERDPDTLLQTEMDAGAPKARQRFTAGTREIRCRVKLQNQAQKDALVAFRQATLAGGALPFTWASLAIATGGGSARFRFTAPIAWARAGAERWIAELSLIRLP